MNTPARLLVIDDEERIRRLLLDFFEDYAEFEPHAVGSAEEGLVDLAREPAALCIVDMRLPGMDGRDFVLAARERGLCRRFLLHTGSMDFSLDESLSSAGLNDRDVFLKPCDMAAMLSRIRELLELPGA